MKKRLYEIAKELDMSSSELQTKIEELGLDIPATNHLVSLSGEEASQLREALSEKKASPKKERKVVGQGVIRRRRKVVRPSGVEPEQGDVDESIEEELVASEPSDSSDDLKDAATSEPTSVPVAAGPPAGNDTPRRQRFATVQTREDEPQAEPAAEAPIASEAVDAPAAATVEVPAEVEEAPARPARSRFATVVTRTDEPVASKPAASEDAPVTDELPALPPKRARFATVVTTSGAEGAAPVERKPKSPIELAEMARREVDAKAAEKGGGKKSSGAARVVGTMNPDVLSGRVDSRAEERRKGRAKPGGAARGKRVVQTGDLYGKFPNRRRRKGGGRSSGGGQSTKITTAAEHKRVIKMEEAITVSELARQMAVKSGELVMKLAFELGVRGATLNTAVDYDTAELLAEQYNHTVEQVGFDLSKYLPVYDDSAELQTRRSPVVTVMGHVDHGKTSLLDAIRNTEVSGDEAGGITQHIGAYKVRVPSGGNVTFLDTPGHEAFTALRARGAKATDIVVLVVAADDGVMPQTIEAINHAQEAKVPIIVAVNKIDKPTANTERVKQALTEFSLVPEEWGGETLYVEVSALKRTGIEKLLETIHLQSEILELKANAAREADGTVIEARLDTGRGPVATVLVQGGTLKNQDIVVTGKHYGRVRTMTDDFNKVVTTAGPSTPVEVTGLSGVPSSGEKFYVVKDEKAARAIADHISTQSKKADMAMSATSGAAEGSSLEEMIALEDVRDLKIIVKGDVQGSVEAVSQALSKLGDETDEVNVRIIHSGVGSITETDVNLAASSDEGEQVIIIGFNVRPESRATPLAEQLGVLIMTRSIIYEVLDEVRTMVGGMLKPIYEEEVLGHAEVRKTFSVSKVGTIAGCMVTDGLIRRNAKARVVRDSRVVYDSAIASLKHFDKDEREVKSGFECGISMERFNDLKVDDVIESYIIHERKATI